MFAYCLNNPVNGADPSGSKMVPVELDVYGSPYQMINGQGLEPYKSMPYGVSTVGFSGCESIAIYNALILIGKARSLQTVMTYMLQSINDGGGYGLYGLGGGTCIDITNTLKQLNIPYSWADYDSLCNVSDSSVLIVGFWGKIYPFKNCSFSIPSIHTVAIQRTGGQFVTYNRYSNSPDTAFVDTLDDLFGGKEKFIYGFVLGN